MLPSLSHRPGSVVVFVLRGLCLLLLSHIAVRNLDSIPCSCQPHSSEHALPSLLETLCSSLAWQSSLHPCPWCRAQSSQLIPCEGERVQPLLPCWVCKHMCYDMVYTFCSSSHKLLCLLPLGHTAACPRHMKNPACMYGATGRITPGDSAFPTGLSNWQSAW